MKPFDFVKAFKAEMQRGADQQAAPILQPPLPSPYLSEDAFQRVSKQAVELLPRPNVVIRASRTADYWVSANGAEVSFGCLSGGVTGTLVRPKDDPAITAAVAAERARIRAALEAIKPGEQPYTRKSWNDERKGELRMWERMSAAIDKTEKE